MSAQLDSFQKSAGASSGVAEEIAARLRQLQGRKVPEIRAVRREFSKRLKSFAPQEVIGIGKLLHSNLNHHRWVAYELLYHHPAALAHLRAQDLEHLGRGISTWDQTDTFGILVAGPVWLRRGIADDVISKWARSEDRWWRRAALVATVPLNSKSHGGRGDVRRTLQICRMLESDRDDMVVKALSWALRALAKIEPQAVQRYVTQRGDALAPRVRREVRNKLTTGLKNPRGRRTQARRSAPSRKRAIRA